MYNSPRFNKKGQPICEICEVGYNRLLLHVVKRHKVTSLEYKTIFNHHPRKGIQSKVLKSKMKMNALKNYNKVITENLLVKGQKTRFKEGNTATNIELVRETSKARMNAYWASKKKQKSTNLSVLIKKLNSL